MIIFRLAWSSLLNRRVAAVLSAVSIALSVALLLGVEKLRHDARTGFSNTISGTDLIVGPRSGSIQLLLYSVFRIGNATNNISWASYQKISQLPDVGWTVPISLGDSHRGFRVMGTSRAYFDHYRYGQRENLRFNSGKAFVETYDAVLGYEVARELKYAMGQNLVLAHGTGVLEINQHTDKPFKVVGILEPTGTPVDRTVHVSLAGIEAIHVNWEGGTPKPGASLGARPVSSRDLQPKAITAFFLGLERRTQMFSMQRLINTQRQEPLQAIIPGVALQELWDLMRVAENSLRIISAFVVVTSLLGMITVILATLEARRREMAVLRAVGARLVHLAGLFVVEVAVLTVVGASLGVLLLIGLTWVAQPIAASKFGIQIPPLSLGSQDWHLLGLIAVSALVVSLLPALRAYQLSLADGLSIRI